jgi:hypothetical protein
VSRSFFADAAGFRTALPEVVASERILSSTGRSEPLGKFLTLSDSSTVYQHVDSCHHDPFGRVLNMELLQFYYSYFWQQTT